jgi:hemerythrin superfamily protein
VTARSRRINDIRAVIGRAYSYVPNFWQAICTKHDSPFPKRNLTEGVSGMYVLKLLKKDHFNVRSLFSKFDRTGKSSHEKRGELFVQIRRELQIHSRAEEEIFYPALKALNDEGRRLVSEALKEHKQVDELLTQISRLKPTDKNFEEKMETLIENVDHHVEEEEGEIFRFAEENCSEEQLEELGRQIEERKKTLDQQMAA